MNYLIISILLHMLSVFADIIQFEFSKWIEFIHSIQYSTVELFSLLLTLMPLTLYRVTSFCVFHSQFLVIGHSVSASMMVKKQSQFNAL